MLLRKCLPDLAAAEIKTEQTHRYVIEIPALSMSSAEWEAEATRAAGNIHDRFRIMACKPPPQEGKRGAVGLSAEVKRQAERSHE